MKLELSGHKSIFEKKPQVSSFMKMCPFGAELFHAGGQTDRHDEANSRVSQFCERV
jgi:hypothetical protein